jgi:adenylate cyclase
MRDAPGSGRLELPREAPSPLRFANFILDLNACTLVRETGEGVALTRGEFALLRVFVTRPGRVLSRDAVLDALANRRFEPFDRSVDVMVGKIRRKIELDPKQPRLIVTVPGEGYRFDGLAKSPLSGQSSTMAVSSSGNALPSEGALSDALSERFAEHDLPEAEARQVEARQVSPAAIDQTKSLASKPGGLVLLWPAVAALLFLAAASTWFVLAGEGAKTTEAARLSIVVMPFANLSGDPAQDYLVDALTDELTTSLARVRDTFVIARNTAMIFKGKPIDAKAIGKDLGVRYVLEGSVQPSDDRMRVNAQLIDAASGGHLWAEQFDTPRADLLQTQDAIVAHLTNALDLQLQQAYSASVKGTPATNHDAEDLALQCSEGQWKAGFIGKEADAAYALCQQALAIDPNNVRALMALGAKFFVPVAIGISSDPRGDLERADELESKALALDPDWTWPHALKGLILRIQGRDEEAVAEHERALVLDPSNAEAAAQLGIDYRFLGRFDKSLEYLDRAMLASPHDPTLNYWYDSKAWANFGLKRYDQAIELARRALAINPKNPFAHVVLVAALALTDHDAEAHEALQRYLAPPSIAPFTTIATWKAYQMSIVPKQGGDPRVLEMSERSYEGLRKAGMPEGEANTH